MREKGSGAPVRRRALTALAVAVLAQLSGPDGAPSAAADDAQIPADETVITLLHTNDLHGSILYPDEPRGIAKIATLARRIRQQMPYVFLLDGGDIIHGTPAEKVFEGQPVIAAMNAAGYDAAAAGNHEFDFGHRIALGAFAAAEFPMLSANVVDAASGEPSVGLQPFIIREVDGVRIAIFGLTTDRTPEIQWPRTIEGIEFRDAVDTARALVPRLRDDEGADLIVALTHIGLDADRELAEAVPGIDIILGGHSHTRVDEQAWVGTTLVAQAGSAARDLGRVDVHLRREGDGAAVIAINGQDGRWWGQGDVPAPLGKDYPYEPLIPLSASIADDPAVTAAYRPYGDSIRAYLEEELTNAAEPLPAEGAGREEIALGNLQADAVRSLTGADIGLSALYSLDPAGLPAGPVRVRDVYQLFGGYTRQHLVVVRAPGESIAEMLNAANDDAFRLHISGVYRRDGTLYIHGSPLEPATLYSVASAAHIIQEHLLQRPRVEVVSDDPEAPTIRNATIELLREHPPLTDVLRPRWR